jgi:hypothetical protein
MMNFFLQGKRPLEYQDWPEILLKHKEAILSQSRSDEMVDEASGKQTSAVYLQR